jgi:hypothetical protein
MTIALASKCEGGAFVYADRLISGASLSEQCKIWYRDLPSSAMALAVATSDFDAANSFAERVLDGLSADATLDTIVKIKNHVESHLLTWSEPYHPDDLPLDSYFLMATAVSGAVHLHFIQPRHTIVPIPHARAVGSGEYVAKPILDGMLPESILSSPQVTLLRMAYVAKRAKEQATGQSGSNAVFVPTTGPILSIKELELKFAEDVTGGLNETAHNILQFMTGLESPEHNDKIAAHWQTVIAGMANLMREHVKFSGL